MNGRSVLASALLAVILIVAGSWTLNNTAVGLNIKCRMFNDLGACFILALTEPEIPSSGGNTYVPPLTETPEERAAREAAEEQERLDAAVRDASSALGRAVDDLLSNADELKAGAADMTSAVSELRSSTDDGMQSAYTALKDQTRIRPMDDCAQNDVCFALNDVEFARNDVDFAVNGFEFAEDPYTTTLESRTGYIAAVQQAVARLNAAVNANPGGVSPQQTAVYADAALSSASSTAKAAATKAGEAKADVTSLVKSADAWMTKARKLAATFASC